eukprot:scaffold53249_cov18-Tisochrysis_lutea.AAC.1
MGHVLDNFWQWSENCHLKPSGPRGLAGILQCRKGGLLTLLSYLVLSSIQDDCVPTSNCKENVLLTSEEQTPGGQVAKLADFGEWYNLKAVALMCTCFCAKGPSVVTQRDILLAFTYLSSVQAWLLSYERRPARIFLLPGLPAHRTRHSKRWVRVPSCPQSNSEGDRSFRFAEHFKCPSSPQQGEGWDALPACKALRWGGAKLPWLRLPSVPVLT